MIIRCIDFETTGGEPDEIVEIGWQDVIFDADGNARLSENSFGSIFVEPGKIITAQARGVHHIRDDELIGAPSRKDALMHCMTEGGVPDAICAHEVRHEQSLWHTNKRPWICTRKSALRLWPDAPDHKLQTLRYWLHLDADPARGFPVHRGGPDAYIGALILVHCLKTAQASLKLEQQAEGCARLIEWTSKPSLLPVCPLRKHKGKPWEEVDSGYLHWMLDQADMDEDLKFTAQHHIDARRPKRPF